MVKTLVPKFIVRNISNGAVSVLSVKIKPTNAFVDLFSARPGLPESTVIDALRAPDGELYKKIWESQELELVEMALVSFSNPVVLPENLQATNSPKPGKFVSVGEDGAFTWVYSSPANALEFGHPLVRDGEALSIPPASATANGYLTKEDWQMFKGKSTGLRVWQYQDFAAPVASSLSITSFQNGKELPFSKSLIVDGSAYIVLKNKLENKPTRKSGLFKKEYISVQQHIGGQVGLSSQPDDKQECRVYFLVALPVGVEPPQDYSQPPRRVREGRVEFIDHYDIDIGDKHIRGKKIFKDQVSLEKTLNVGQNLDVAGLMSTDKIKIANGAVANYGLSSNSLGEGHWAPNPFVSESAPTNAYQGQLWVRSPDFELFIYDGARSKWLSCNSSFEAVGAINKSGVSNSYLKTLDNMSTLSNGDVVPYDSTLTCIIASCEVAQNWKAEIHINGQPLNGGFINVVNNDKAFLETYNIDVKEGTKIQLFASGESISLPRIKAIFRKRG